MKKLVPDWLIQFLWFLASICASGAIWYFLSKNDNTSALASLAGAIVFSSLAIYHHRLNDRQSRNLAHRLRLAGFIEESQQLRERLNETPLPIQDVDDWINRVITYLQQNLDNSHTIRFGDFTGMVFYSDGSEASRLKTQIDGRTRRLHEFLSELSQ